ncbi:MAG: UvrD-helicase domain-containing protein [Prevotella sp.]|nr:UvrD-helicase domain-containing protein [Prevotella sp.]
MKRYDDRQQEVIDATGGYHLVLAAPGCGKTEVLAERIRRAADRGVDFGDMLCLTFTNRAARAMTERIANTEGIDRTKLGDLYVGNIHRYCSRLLYEKGVVSPEAAIIDEDDSLSILADILGDDEVKVAANNRLRHRYSEMVNLSHFMHQYTNGYPRELIVHQDAVDTKAMKAICTALNRPFTRQSITEIYRDIDDLGGLKQLTQSYDTAELTTRLMAAKRYEHYKRQHELMDFEDLLLKVYELPDEQLNKFHWIQVDEIQDLNPLQLRLIDRFTADEAFTVMYLGDQQQAIFSFMGAKLDTLGQLNARCPRENIHHLHRNYRSPRYLLDVYNEYGNIALGIDLALLPQTDHEPPHDPEDLQILMSRNSVDEHLDVARFVQRLVREHEKETTAIIVSYNAEADELSSALKGVGVKHFKISGRDLFAEPNVKVLLAHLNVVFNDRSFIDWSRLLVGLGAITSHAPARAFVRRMMDIGLSPSDFLHDDQRTTLERFAQCYDEGDIVVFDTETTGLNVFDDDIVQIAAVRLSKGKLVGEPFNVFLQTNRPIPPMLGDIPNPILEAYAEHEPLAPAEGLKRFLDYAKGATLLAHNASFDMHILDNNLRRQGMTMNMGTDETEWLDSLKVAQLIYPGLESHKLKDLLQTFHLEGQNSHLADDDIMATVSLVHSCRSEVDLKLPLQADFIKRHQHTLRKFRMAYQDVYRHTRQMLYRRFPADEPPALVTEMAYVYNQLLEAKLVKPIEKLSYLMAYLAEDVVDPSERSLYEQLQGHLTDINTYKESDLCGSRSMRERVFVSTVHKAKGLEFDNVVLFDCTDSNYPGYFARQSAQGLEEERRRFYVALSRARRRLFLTWSPQKISNYGRVFQTQLSPFTLPIQRFFLMRGF